MEAYEINVRRLEEFSAGDAAELGRLTAQVNSNYDGSPIPEDSLTNIIDSERSDQFVAEINGKIVGAMTLNLLVTPNARKVYLDNLVTDREYRQRGVASALWDIMLEWCDSHNGRVVDWLSGAEFDAAHGFYRRRGAHLMHNLGAFRLMIED